MQKTSDLYKDIITGTHRKEVSLAIGRTGTLATNNGERITFGGIGILIAMSDADGGYGMDKLVSLKTNKRVFSGDSPSVGDCIAGEISVKMLQPNYAIPRQARLVPYVRVTDGVRYSEWIQKGVYFIDTRETDDTGKNKWLTIHGFDSMLKAEEDYPSSSLQWPAKDIDVVREIASAMDVDIDKRTLDFMTAGYLVEYPSGYSQREVLGYIGAMYAGSWIMNDVGELRLITMYNIPKESRVLIDRQGNALTIGGVRIRV